jgi:hypothetical protein
MSVSFNPAARSTMVPSVSQLVELQGHTYEDGRTVSAALLETLKRCGCWLEERKNVSSTRMERMDICFEVRLSAADELYSGLVAAGVEFTREAHQAMTWLCTLRRHEGPRSLRTVCVRMEMSFLEEYAQEMGMMATGHA